MKGADHGAVFGKKADNALEEHNKHYGEIIKNYESEVHTKLSCHPL